MRLIRRMTAVVMIAALTLALCSCAPFGDMMGEVFGTEAPTESFEPVTVIEQVHDEYHPIVPRYSYATLSTDAQRLLYDRMLDAVYHVSSDADEGLYPTEKIELDVAMSEEDIRRVMKAFYDDNPDIWWVSTTYLRLIDEERDYTMVRLYADVSPDMIETRNRQLHDAVGAFLDTVPTGLTTYELEKLTHDYLLDTCAYDTEVDSVESYLNDHPDLGLPYGALVDHTAVCEGYARAMQLLLNRLGVGCVCIIGQGQGELHMWNAVLLDDGWYLVDPTWDDQQDDQLRYNYFNLTESQMNEDHIPADAVDNDDSYMSANLYLPDCDRTTFNYFSYECVHLNDLYDNAIADALYEAAAGYDDVLFIYVEPSAYTVDEAIRYLITDYPQQLFDDLDEVNRRLPDYSVDDSNIRYFSDDTLHILGIELSYL